jgi:hypothetical protein
MVKILNHGFIVKKNLFWQQEQNPSVKK